MTGAGAGAGSPLEAAAHAAPSDAGVYFFISDGGELLYVGKAGDLRRRLGDHARAAAAGSVRYGALYAGVARVAWEVAVDEPAATAREADLIVALQPSHNSFGPGALWHYVQVGWPAAGGSQPAAAAFEVVAARGQPAAAGSRAGTRVRSYGAFPKPRLLAGLSGPGTEAGATGYAALLRLLWAAAPQGGGAGRQPPGRITGRALPSRHRSPVDPAWGRAVHDFLSGVSGRLLDVLFEALEDTVPAPARASLARDLVAADTFFRAGPVAARQLRRRHGLPAGPVPPAAYEQLLRHEVEAVIGPFTTAPRLPEALTGMRISRHRFGVGTAEP